MSNVKITIPKPCTENWENMKPLEKGRFCDSCEKEVLDFTKFSTTELTDYFKYPKGNVCGRINDSQLVDSILLPSQTNNFKYLIYKLFVASFLTLLTSVKSYSNEVGEKNTVYQNDQLLKTPIVDHSKIDSLITISGIIRALEDGLPIPGAKITLKGRPEFTVTGVDGKFKFQLKPDSLQKVILVVQYLGYETKEIEAKIANRQDLAINLTLQSTVMGEVVVVRAGGIVVKRSLTNRIGYFFKRVFTGRY